MVSNYAMLDMSRFVGEVETALVDEGGGGGGDWILANGVWDDAAQWDDTAMWKDAA